MVKILNSLPDRAAVPAGTVSPVGFPAETRDGAGTRPCGLAHSVPPASLGANRYAGSEDERQPGRRKRPFGSGPVQLRFFHGSAMG